jgi:hypothetical protein
VDRFRAENVGIVDYPQRKINMRNFKPATPGDLLMEEFIKPLGISQLIQKSQSARWELPPLAFLTSPLDKLCIESRFFGAQTGPVAPNQNCSSFEVASRKSRSSAILHRSKTNLVLCPEILSATWGRVQRLRNCTARHPPDRNSHSGISS